MLSQISEDFYQRFKASLERFAPFEEKPTIAVGISGGVDSLALTFLLKRWVDDRGGYLMALHVDHGLRKTSKQEALQVKEWLDAHGIENHTLAWDHNNPQTSLQERARHARYDLLTGFCRTHHILHLCVAHHLEDQAETIAYRASRGSGPDGLAGMSFVEEFEDVRLLRPLLDFSKKELKVCLGDHPHIEDPSNMDPRFWRGRFRTQNTAPQKMEPHTEDRTATEQSVALALYQYTVLSELGYATVDKGLFEAESREVQRRVIEKILTTVGGHSYPVRSTVVETLLSKLESTFSQATAGGCLVRHVKDHILFVREWSRIQDCHKIHTDEAFSWDGRFHIEPNFPLAQDLCCKALGDVGWLQIKGHLKTQPLPHTFYKGLPAFFDERGEVIFCPFGDFKKPERMVDLANVRFRPRSRLLRSIWFS